MAQGHSSADIGRMRVLLYAVVALLVTTAMGQGLKRSGSLSASNAASASLAQKYAADMSNAQALASAYKSLSTSQRQSCSGGKNKAALCASQGSNDVDAVSLALNPLVFSWTNPPGSGGGGIPMVNPFGPVGNQGECSTCVSFAVAAAAEAAVARTLGLSGGTVKLSVQDLGFCPESSGDIRFCMDAWDIRNALAKLQRQQIVSENCLRYQTSQLDDTGTKCNYACKNPDAYASKGQFKFRTVRTLAGIQRHVRQFGGMITRLNIYKDFRPFFQRNPSGVYDGAGCQGDQVLEEHAVVIVGYNNAEKYWVIRNSWGPGFADQGYFKIRYGVCGVGDYADSYGIMWVPNTSLKIPVSVSPDSEKKGCFIYRARAGDSIGFLADTWGVDPVELLYNNSAAIDDLSVPIDGKLLTVCDISSNNVELKTPLWAASWAQQDQVTPTYTPTKSEMPKPRSSGGSSPSSSTTTTTSSSSVSTESGSPPSSSSSSPPSSSSSSPPATSTSRPATTGFLPFLGFGRRMRA